MIEALPITIISCNSGYLSFIDILINRRETRMLVDSGASITLIDVYQTDNLSLSIPPNNSTHTFIMMNEENDGDIRTADEVDFGSLHLKNFNFHAISMSNINNSLVNNRVAPAHGIIGMDFMYKHQVKLDFAKKQFEIWR